MRTLDPYAADLFFVPIFAIYGQAGNVGCPDVDVAVAAHHLQRTMPYFWQRHGGADHVFFATGDKGFCAMDTVGTQLAKNPIFVSHFGLLGGLGAMLPNAKLDKRAHTLEQQLKNGEWIFAPHKDVVVPAYVQAGEPRTAPPGCPILPRPEQLDKCTPRGINLSRGWRNLLVHAGGTAWSKCPLGSAPARLLRLLRARLVALGNSALPRGGRPTGRPATAAGARASRLQSRPFHLAIQVASGVGKTKARRR